MPVTAVVGANWGDEGKGKLCDYLAESSDLVIRFQGGSNAGHTVINQYGKFSLHLVPCGVFHTHTTNLLGPGVGVNVAALLEELAELRARGAPNPQVLVAERAQVVLPYHVELDRLEEARRGAAKFGSTQSGMAPFYADKYLKVGIQVGELFDADHLRRRLRQTLPRTNVLLEHLYGAAPLPLDPLLEELLALGTQVRELAVDSTTLLQAALRDGKRILLEGQLGALRDPDHGIYPFTTSSSPLAGFATVGAGVPARAIERVVATVKAYSSCVGAGPFTTELSGPCGDELRERGGDAGEYGATTGRPRRVGWFDAVATRYGCAVQGASELAVTLLDVLGYLDAIPICTAYEVDGRRVDDFPATAVLERARPVYETLPGWRCDISGARSFAELPPEAQSYVQAIEAAAGVPVRWISIGPRREQLIHII
jgi:adenylosuccinate synthase